MRVLLAVPCYNCEPQIRRVLAELDDVLSAAALIAEVAVIDNRSTDGVVDAAIEMISKLKNKGRIHLYRNIDNVGLGGTHKVAFELARESGATHFAILHGDNQATTADLLILIKHLVEFGGETVLGSRFSDLSLLSGYSYVRIFGNLALNLLYSVVTGRRVKDLGSGLNIFRINDFEPHDLHRFDNGFTFNMDLLLYLISKKRKFHYVPIHWSTVDQVSNARALSVGWKTLKKLWFWAIDRRESSAGNFKTEKVI